MQPRWVGPRGVILEDRLFPGGKLPSPGFTDPNHGRSWVQDPRSALYRPVQAKVSPGLWLNFFVREKAPTSRGPS